MILLIGSEGAQGKRYQAILRHLDVPFLTVDLHNQMAPLKLPYNIHGAIIATPTDTHVSVLLDWLFLDVPFLVEKPFTKNVAELRRLSLSHPKLKLCMVMQYRQIARSLKKEPTWYDYFRHGSDGLIWDCLQPIALARGPFSVAEDSPIWDCAINGEKLHIQDMDNAYVLEVEDWLRGRTQSYFELIDIHEAVSEYARKQ